MARVTRFGIPDARTTLDGAVTDLDAQLARQANNSATGFEPTKTRDRQRRTLLRDRMAEVVRMVGWVVPGAARSLPDPMRNEHDAEPRLR